MRWHNSRAPHISPWGDSTPWFPHGTPPDTSIFVGYPVEKFYGTLSIPAPGPKRAASPCGEGGGVALCRPLLFSVLFFRYAQVGKVNR